MKKSIPYVDLRAVFFFGVMMVHTSSGGELPSGAGDHWAFVPPIPQTVPAHGDPNCTLHPIDAFVDAKHALHGLRAAPSAPKQVLLRRVYFDLVGLPPTRTELHAFLADDSPDAYERAVDRLLASPQHAERWARHWMDIWRYSDWTGFGEEIRYSQKHIWHWRDWIIESLAEDKGYDQMIIEMVAGDEAAPGDRNVMRATGFLARNWYKFDRNVWLDDTIEHTAKAFLAMTFDCARCHDHKYDPVSQKEYYQLRAIFEPYGVRTDRVPGQLDVNLDGLPLAYDAESDAETYLFLRGDPKQPDKDTRLAPGIPSIFEGPPFDPIPVSLPTESYYPSMRTFVIMEMIAQQNKAVANAETALSKAKQEEMSEPEILLAEKKLASARAGLASMHARIAAEKAKLANAPNFDELAQTAGSVERLAALASAEEKVLAARQEREGALAARRKGDAKTEEAVSTAEKKLAEAEKALESAREKSTEESANYQALGEIYPDKSTGRRLAFARWIADRRNPLTARVAVNHIWSRHFGVPLVEKVDDFGLRSPPPRNRELLDYLALDFMRHGWSMKRLHRQMVTSTTYRMASRLEDAAIRSANLAIDRDNRFWWRMHSPRLEAEAVRDSILHVAGGLDLAVGGPDIDHEKGQIEPRRSLYFRHARERQMEFLLLFDAANPRGCYRRRTSVRPQQAFALINSSLTIAQSRRLVNQESDETCDDAFVTRAFEDVLGREPSAAELVACREFLDRQARQLATPENLELLGNSENAVAPATEPRMRARENLILVLFNHSDFVTLR